MKLSNCISVSLSVGVLIGCAPGPEGNTTVDAKAAPAPAAVVHPELVVPAGAHLAVIVETAVSSKTSQPGDRMDGHLAQDLRVGNTVVARAGNAVHGRVTAATPSGRVKTRARLAFAFESLVVEGGVVRPIATQAVDITANDTHTHDAVAIGAGAGAAAIIGGIIDGGKGAGLGALIGAGAGTGVVLVDKGHNVNIAAGGTLSIELTQSLKIRM